MAIDYRTKQDEPTREKELIGTVVKYDSRPDEYTVYPRDVDGEALVTHWITAKEGSYVDLESMR
ncbi:DUF7511 domain-containing protein [Haladaptatus sp. NG-SE-30]